MSTTPFPRGPRGQPLIGHIRQFRSDPLAFLTSLRAEYGDMAHFRIGTQHALLLSNPDDIRDVLVTHHRQFLKGRALQRSKRVLGDGLLTSEGEFHLRQRRLAAPAFHRKRIETYADVMAAYAARTRDRWQPGTTIDVSRDMMELTMAIVGKTLFDADVEAEADQVGEALTTLMRLFRTITLPFYELMERLPLPSRRRFEAARDRLDTIIYRIIDERRRSGHDTGDLLSMLMASRDEQTGEAMTDKQLRDEALTLFLAGHETTANALSWTWYLLSQNPEAEARFHAEIDAVLGGRLPAIADLPQLRVTEQIVSEALRLYPPAWIIGRMVREPYRLHDYTLPRGTLVIMSQYVMHRDPRYFDQPDRFLPERWTPEFRATLPRFAYFPFGGGPRVCIGEQFAWMEGILLLATIGQRWRLRLAPGHPVAPEPLITLRPRHGMRMIVEPR